MKPILIVDARSLLTGIGRYTLSFLSGLREKLPSTEIWCITNPCNQSVLKPIVDRVLVSSAEMYSVKAQIEIPILAKHGDLLHCQHYNVPIFTATRFSVTIHDVTHLLDPVFRKSLKSRLIASPLLKTAALKAERIITVSEYSKRMIVEHLGVEPRKVRVSHCSVNPIFYPMDAEVARLQVRKYSLQTKSYFLFVGNLKPHKNLALLFKAYALLASRYREIPDLVLVSNMDRRWMLTLLELASELKIEANLHWIKDVDDHNLRALYVAAEALILPSTEEGFGLPVIEAMACGTPVLCSNTASLPEIAGDSALFFSPIDPEELYMQMDAVLESEELRNNLRDAGRERVKLFSAEQSCEQHASIFAELLFS